MDRHAEHDDHAAERSVQRDAVHTSTAATRPSADEPSADEPSSDAVATATDAPEQPIQFAAPPLQSATSDSKPFSSTATTRPPAAASEQPVQSSAGTSKSDQPFRSANEPADWSAIE